MAATRKALTALAAALACAGAQAATGLTVWSGPNFGSWFHAPNWSAGVPDWNKAAVIDGGLASVPTGTPAVFESLVVGSSANRPVSGLGVGTALIGHILVVGLGSGSTGLVTVGLRGDVQLGEGGLQVGTDGNGTVRIDGGTVSSYGPVRVGIGHSGDGTVRVNGGLLQSSSGPFDVGVLGHGLVSIEGGGTLNGFLTPLQLARLGGTADFRVTGTGSRATLRSVSGRPGASVTVENGGYLKAHSIDEQGASWSVRAGSVVDVSTFFRFAPPSRLSFTLSDRGTGGAGQVFANTFELDGTLSIALAGSFTPALGDSWQLLAGQVLTGTFGRLDLPALPAGLRWDDSALYASGTLSVAAVPEPSVTVLFGIGLAVLCGLRQRRA